MKKTVIIGSYYAQGFGEALAGQGFSPVYIPANGSVDKNLAFHADLSVISLPGGRLVAAEYLVKSGHLCSLPCEIITSSRRQGGTYPYDVPLCACVAGDRLICNRIYTDESILQNFNGGIIDVNQGYANCSVCALPDGAIISADEGILVAADERGVDTLKIGPGHVNIEGFKYGFIGGASFCAEDTLYFFGDVTKHPDYEKIGAFARLHKVKICSLTAGDLTDIGGAVVI